VIGDSATAVVVTNFERKRAARLGLSGQAGIEAAPIDAG
jgi:hypothetical protein